MELRVLKYFLMVAREENITKAAQLLHITQPTLSRQLMQLEDELGVKLLNRGKYSVSLTQDGMLLKRRAQELVSLSEKTIQELSHKEGPLSGEISIGCGETKSMSILADQIASFQSKHPMVQFKIYSAIADDIKERIEKGILDMGLLTEPVNIGKYEFTRLPLKETWGVLVREDSALARRGAVGPEDLRDTPLLMGSRELVKSELTSWFGNDYEQLHVSATYNLIVNAAAMVRSGIGAALCLDLGVTYEGLVFVPLAPALETGSVLVWKKNQTQSDVISYFLQHVKDAI